MNNPEVSVVIAFRNNEHSLGKCLECLLKQTYKNMELILVDDQSTDKSTEIARAYAGRFKKVKIIRNEKHLFQGGSLNKGIKEASGCFIQLLDSDYYLEESSIENAVKFLEETPSVAVLHGSVWLLKRNYRDYWVMLRHVSMLGGYQKRKIREVKTFSNNIAMIRKKVLDDCEVIYRPELTRCFDMEFSTRLYTMGHQFVYFPELKAEHDHPLSGWREYVVFLRKSADGYVRNRTVTPSIHYNFIKNRYVFYLLIPFLPFGSTLKKIVNGTEPAVYKNYPLILPVLFIGQVYFWFRVWKKLTLKNR